MVGDRIVNCSFSRFFDGFFSLFQYSRIRWDSIHQEGRCVAGHFVGCSVVFVNYLRKQLSPRLLWFVIDLTFKSRYDSLVCPLVHAVALWMMR